jgi:sulfofructose kinase
MPPAPLIIVSGIAALDTIYPISTPLVAGDKHRCPRVEIVLGGNAANAARAIRRLGGRAELLVRLGADDTAARIRADLDAEGVGHALSPPLAGCQTSRSAIIIEPGGARTIANMFDPAFPEQPDWLPAALPAGTAAVLGDIRWEGATLRLLTLARAAGIPGVLDGDRAPKDRRLLAAASHIAFSMQGLAELTGATRPEAALRAYAASEDAGLAIAPGQTVAVTHGAEGVYLLLDGAVERIPAPEVAAVDTLGAGDVWHGAFTLALAEGQALAPAIAFANLAAAIKCTRPGGGAGAPKRAEMVAMLATPSTNPPVRA